MSEILTVTLNPALDVATSVESVIAGPKLRCRPPRIDPGGGGVNVARAIRKLGGDPVALVVAGGANGDHILSLLRAEGVRVLPVAIPGETRQSFAVIDEGTGEQFRFSVPGYVLDAQDSANILADAAAAAPKDGYVVLSGSVAPGLPVDFPAALNRAIAPKTDRLIVDTSGPALTHLIENPTTPVHLLRIDQKEAAEAAEHPMNTAMDSFAFASSLVDRGVADIVVTGRGAEGSIMATKDQRFFCHAPKVEVRSKIGAGDAFVGSLTLRLSLGEPLEQALRWGVAGSSATVGTEGTALCDLDRVMALLPSCIVNSSAA